MVSPKNALQKILKIAKFGIDIFPLFPPMCVPALNSFSMGSGGQKKVRKNEISATPAVFIVRWRQHN